MCSLPLFEGTEGAVCLKTQPVPLSYASDAILAKSETGNVLIKREPAGPQCLN